MATRVCFIDIPPQKDSSSNDILECTNALQQQQRHHHGILKERSLSPMSPVPPSSPRYERNMGFFHQLSRRFGLRSNDDLIYSTGGEDDSHSSSTDSCSSTTGTLPPPIQHQQQQQRTSASSTSSSTATMTSNKDAAMLQQLGSSLEHLSCASSETSSTLDINDEQLIIGNTAINGAAVVGNTERKLSTASKSSTRSSFSRLHRRSTSSIRRAFESFSISSRSLSCSGATPPQKEGSCSASPAKSALKTVSSLDLHKKSTAVANSGGGATKSKSQQPPQRILRQPVSYTYLKGMSGLPTQRVPRTAVCCSYVRR